METNPFAPPKASVLEAAAGDEDRLVPDGRKVAASRGTAWLTEAWPLFTSAAGAWILIFIIFMAMTLVLAIIPGGSIVSYLLQPVFTAGMMLGCRDIEAGSRMEVSHLFAGFKQSTGNLILVGLLYMVGLVVVTIVAFIPMMIAMPFLAPLFEGIENADMAHMAMTVGPLVLLFILLVIALALPLVMALWFAPPLVVFHDMQPMAAMKASFLGCLKNFVPFLVYGVVGLFFFILALIPVGLGLLVFVPVVWASIYTGYRDIYLRPA
jgi:uncharacterized membrane protein